MTNAKNSEIVRKAYADFTRGDLDAVLSVISEDVVWVNSDELPNGGTDRGLQELRATFEKPSELWIGYHVEVEMLLEADQQYVVMLGTQRGTGMKSGLPLDAALAAVYRLEGGKIVYARQYPDTAKALKALGLAR